MYSGWEGTGFKPLLLRNYGDKYSLDNIHRTKKYKQMQEEI